MLPKDADRMVDPNQIAIQEQFDLGLHCLHRPFFIKKRRTIKVKSALIAV